jgi:hypothetical protein
VRSLLAAGADPRLALTRIGFTALDFANCFKQTQIIRLLEAKIAELEYERTA